MLEIILEYVSVIALSSVKMLPGLALALVYQLSILEIFICVGGGGILGVFLFTIAGEQIRKWLKARRMRKMKDKPAKPIKIKKARKILRIWNKYGLLGVAILTPPVISPPIGSIISVAFRASRSRILIYMAISVIVWSGLFAILGEQILELVGEK